MPEGIRASSGSSFPNRVVKLMRPVSQEANCCAEHAESRPCHSDTKPTPAVLGSRCIGSGLVLDACFLLFFFAESLRTGQALPEQVANRMLTFLAARRSISTCGL